MNITVISNDYKELISRVIADDLMKSNDENEKAFANRQVLMAQINSVLNSIADTLGVDIYPIADSSEYTVGDKTMIAIDTEHPKGFSIMDRANADFIPLYYADKVPVNFANEIIGSNPEWFIQSVESHRKLCSDDELLSEMKTAIDMPQYKVIDEDELQALDGGEDIYDFALSPEVLIEAMQSNKQGFTVVMGTDDMVIEAGYILDTCCDRFSTCEEVFGDVPEEIRAELVETFKDAYEDCWDNHAEEHYTKPLYDEGEAESLANDISAGAIGVTLDAKGDDRNGFGYFRPMYALINDEFGVKNLYKLPVYLDDETGELISQKEIEDKLTFIVDGAEYDNEKLNVTFDVPDSKEIMADILDNSVNDDRAYLSKTNADLKAYSPFNDREQDKEPHRDMTVITMQDLEDTGFVNMLKNRNVGYIPR